MECVDTFLACAYCPIKTSSMHAVTATPKWTCVVMRNLRITLYSTPQPAAPQIRKEVMNIFDWFVTWRHGHGFNDFSALCLQLGLFHHSQYDTQSMPLIKLLILVGK